MRTNWTKMQSTCTLFIRYQEFNNHDANNRLLQSITNSHKANEFLIMRKNATNRVESNFKFHESQ